MLLHTTMVWLGLHSTCMGLWLLHSRLLVVTTYLAKPIPPGQSIGHFTWHQLPLGCCWLGCWCEGLYCWLKGL